MRSFTGLVILALAALPACSTAEDVSGVDAGAETLPFEFTEPGIDQIAPNSLALGDVVQVFGSEFVPSEYGSTTLHLDGTYLDATGNQQKFVGTFDLDVKNPSVGSFAFDELVFSPTRDQIGTFTGKATIISRIHDEYFHLVDTVEMASERKEMSLTVEPSISVTQLRSVSEPGCSPFSKATTGGQQIALSAGVLGVANATESNPIRVQLSFNTPTLQVKYIKDDGYAVWPIPVLEPAFTAEPAAGESQFEVRVTSGNTFTLDPTWRQDRIRVTPGVQFGQESYNDVLLGYFGTGPTEGRTKATTITITATMPNGDVIRRMIPYEVREAWEIQEYDQNVRLMESSDPVPVSACYSGGDIGRDLTYTEGSSFTESRSLSFRWDRNVANSLGVTAGVGGLLPVVFQANASTTFSESFGTDVNQTITTENHVGTNFTAKIIPGYYGVSYRQVYRLERAVDVVYTNACGSRGVIGQTVLRDWNFGFDIATGPDCNPSTGTFPQSDLYTGGNYEPEGVPFNPPPVD